MNTRIKLLILVPNLFIMACSHYQLKTNLDSAPIKDYFAVSDVKVYQKDKLNELNYQYITTVEGESCQENEQQAPVNDADARTDARKKAAKLGANAIVFDNCIDLAESTSDCIKTRLCYGKAMKVLPVTIENK